MCANKGEITQSTYLCGLKNTYHLRSMSWEIAQLNFPIWKIISRTTMGLNELLHPPVWHVVKVLQGAIINYS
jgi:hypothetical protein